MKVNKVEINGRNQSRFLVLHSTTMDLKSDDPFVK